MKQKLKQIFTGIKNTIIYLIYKLQFRLTSITDEHISYRKVVKTSIFDSHLIKVEDYGYSSLLIENFVNTKILQNILNEYRKENLKFFKCLVLFKPSNWPNSIIISLERVYTINSNPNQVVEDLKYKFIEDLDRYEEDDEFLVINEICVKVIFLDPDFMKSRKREL
jgi:hypothetical protein